MTSTTHSTDGEEPDAEARVIMDNIHRGDLPADDFLTHEDVGEPPQAPEAEVAEIAKRHEAHARINYPVGVSDAIAAFQDRATLLRLLASRQPGLTEEEREEIAAIKGALEVAADINVDPLFAIIGRLTGQPAGESNEQS